jgi:hypothetical protein
MRSNDRRILLKTKDEIFLLDLLMQIARIGRVFPARTTSYETLLYTSTLSTTLMPAACNRSMAASG